MREDGEARDRRRAVRLPGELTEADAAPAGGPQQVHQRGGADATAPDDGEVGGVRRAQERTQRVTGGQDLDVDPVGEQQVAHAGVLGRGRALGEDEQPQRAGGGRELRRRH